MIDLSEKVCEHCHQPIRKGDGYAETDIGTGKWVHWPACPPYSPEKLTEREIERERPVQPVVGELFIVDGLSLKDYYDLRDLRLLLWGLEKELIGKHGIVEAEPLASKVRDLIKKKVEQVSSKIGSGSEHHSSPQEGNLIERYNACMATHGGSSEVVHIRANATHVCMAEILGYLIADEVKAQQEYRQLLELLPEHKTKILEIMGDEATHEKELRQILMQVTQTTISLPEPHHSNSTGLPPIIHGGASEPVTHHSSLKHNKVGTIKEPVTIEQIGIVDEGTFLEDIQDIAKKFDPSKSIIENLRQQGFIAMRFSTTPKNYDPTHLDWYFVADKPNRLLTIVESKTSPEHHSLSVTKEEAEAEINVLIDNLAEVARKGGEIPDYLRQALQKNFMFFKENPHPLVSTGNPIKKFDVKYIDLATGKTVEKTISAKEQFDLYKQQREGKISIVSIHPSASTGNSPKLEKIMSSGVSESEYKKHGYSMGYFGLWLAKSPLGTFFMVNANDHGSDPLVLVQYFSTLKEALDFAVHYYKGSMMLWEGEPEIVFDRKLQRFDKPLEKGWPFRKLDRYTEEPFTDADIQNLKAKYGLIVLDRLPTKFWKISVTGSMFDIKFTEGQLDCVHRPVPSAIPEGALKTVIFIKDLVHVPYQASELLFKTEEDARESYQKMMEELPKTEEGLNVDIALYTPEGIRVLAREAIGYEADIKGVEQELVAQTVSLMEIKKALIEGTFAGEKLSPRQIQVLEEVLRRHTSK